MKWIVWDAGNGCRIATQNARVAFSPSKDDPFYEAIVLDFSFAKDRFALRIRVPETGVEGEYVLTNGRSQDIDVG